MAIDDLPMPVVTFLNAIGVPWPYINEDQVTHFATLMRQFGTAVQATSGRDKRRFGDRVGAHGGVDAEHVQWMGESVVPARDRDPGRL